MFTSRVREPVRSAWPPGTTHKSDGPFVQEGDNVLSLAPTNAPPKVVIPILLKLPLKLPVQSNRKEPDAEHKMGRRIPAADGTIKRAYGSTNSAKGNT